MSMRTRKGPSAPEKDGTPPPGRAAGEADRPSFSGDLRPVRAVVGVNNIGLDLGPVRRAHPGGEEAAERGARSRGRRGRVLRLGGAAVDAHLDALQREKLLRDALVDLVGTDNREALLELRAAIAESGARVRVRYLDNRCASAASLAAVDALLATGSAR